MPKATYAETLKRWKTLSAVLAIRADALPPQITASRDEKAAGARFETDSDGRAQDRFDDQGASSV